MAIANITAVVACRQVTTCREGEGRKEEWRLTASRCRRIGRRTCERRYWTSVFTERSRQVIGAACAHNSNRFQLERRPSLVCFWGRHSTPDSGNPTRFCIARVLSIARVASQGLERSEKRTRARSHRYLHQYQKESIRIGRRAPLQLASRVARGRESDSHATDEQARKVHPRRDVPARAARPPTLASGGASRGYVFGLAVACEATSVSVVTVDVRGTSVGVSETHDPVGCPPLICIARHTRNSLQFQGM
ncbi:hypothetical protein C8R46DRAFT_386860 [Mycena filopes]|nr:hypothetical protein C8R46DRAFT_386860 [Mycena filopes]